MNLCFQSIAFPFSRWPAKSAKPLTKPNHNRPACFPNANFPPRAASRMCSDTTQRPCSNSTESDIHPTGGAIPESAQPCTYCNDVGSVQCPVCEGRGYHGRTITCYYCRGAMEIECPLCVDDVYRFSYVASDDSDIADGQDSVTDTTMP